VRANGLTGSFWPTDRQKLLLRAALGGGGASVEAWRRLRPSLDLDALGPESSVLLPLVQRQLVGAGLEDPLLPSLTGMRRRTWYVNQLRLERLTPALLTVQESGVEALVVYGWELPGHYYGDFGVRAVAGLELLVRPQDTGRAARALVAAGWTRDLRESRARALFFAASGDECVVHSRLLDEFPGEEKDGSQPAELWESGVEFDLRGVAARALGPTDELLSVCLRGARMGAWVDLMWLADACTVLGAAGSGLDWTGLVRRATRLRATLQLRDALLFLRSELDAPVPGGVVEELEQVLVSRRELLAHRAAGMRWPLLGAPPHSLTRFLRLTANRNPLAALTRLPSFLRDEWSLERRSQVPLAAARKGLARIGAGAPRRFRRW
jgi:hypothetical protein